MCNYRDDKVTDYHKMVNISTPVADRKKLNIGDLWINAAICKKCGDMVRSHNQHDYRTCKCGHISVDGGSWYAKRSWASGSFENSMENVVVPFSDASIE